MCFANSIVVSSYNDQNKGIYVKTSSDKVTVLGQSYKDIRELHPNRALRYVETFTVNEITDLSINEYEYFAVSVNDSGHYGYYNSSVLIVGTRNNTVLKLAVTQPVTTRVGDINATLIPGREYSFVINMLQTIYLSSYYDLTGTRIVTNNPVSVFSGHQRGRIDYYTFSYLIEQMPPTVFWGNNHYITPLSNHHSKYAMKALATSECVLNVCCTIYKNLSISLKSGKSILLMLPSNETCTVVSSFKILVVQFSFEDSMIMTLIPPTKHYLNKITFYTFLSGYKYKKFERFIHYIIIVLAQYYQPDMIYMVTRGTNKSLATQEWTEIKINNITEAYGTTINNISLGTGQIIHTNEDALMSVMVYESNIRLGFGTAANAFNSIIG